MSFKWIIRQPDQDLVHRICSCSGVSPVIAQVLAMRQITRLDQIQAFLDHKLVRLSPPLALPGVAEAIPLLVNAITERSPIVVYGDYDCDGMTATAILFRCLTLLGAEVSYFVPTRDGDGYGLNSHQVRRLAERGCRLLVTVDCGIASVDEVRLARELGLQVILTDHHQPGPVLPEAHAIVHPSLPGRVGPFPHFCGAGVALKLAWGLLQQVAGGEKLPPPMRDLMFYAIGLAAIGTIADVVPLAGENRILVHHGLKLIPQFGGKGLQQLARLAKLDPQNKPLGSEDIAFGLGPRLNAAGRVGPPALGVELLVTDDEKRAAELAEYIDNLNQSRISIERSILIAANKQIEADFDPVHDPALVIAGSGWNKGVIGIVAGRLAEKHHRPAVVIATDPAAGGPATGSARSALGIDLFAALTACREHLVQFGGHTAAAGLQILPDQIDAFRQAFCEEIGRLVPDTGREAELEIDVEAPLCQLTVDSVLQLEQLAPFGAGNPRPILCASGLSLVGEPRTMGGDGRHLSVDVVQDGVRMRCVAFGKAEWSEDLQKLGGIGLDLAFKPVINDFRGSKRVELHLIDYRPTRLKQVASA